MERRELMKALATGTAGIGAGMALFGSSTDSASAAVTMDEFAISSGEATTQDGEITDVGIKAAGSWEYDLPSGKNPATWQVVLQVTKEGQSAIVDAATGDAKYLSNNGSYSLNGSLLATELYSASDFEATEDGATNTTDLSLSLWFQVHNENETEIARAELSDSATASVTNKAYNASEHGSVSGDGEVVIVT
jgi:hypothetical protein